MAAPFFHGDYMLCKGAPAPFVTLNMPALAQTGGGRIHRADATDGAVGEMDPETSSG